MREYRQLLRNVPFDLVSLDDVGVTHEVEETGHTFAENAVLKATGYGTLAGMLTLADDSGLEVAALGGEPGVLSARYGEKSPLTPLYQRGGITVPRLEETGLPMGDQDRVGFLLRNLEDIPWERRIARFRCVLAIWAPDSQSLPYGSPQSEDGEGEDLVQVVGSVAGMIQYEPAGDEGFGYDPVFYLPSFGRTMAQLTLGEKNRISHRANAAGKAQKLLRNPR